MNDLHKCMYQLLSYNYLEQDWDGYGAIKPKKEVISAAWRLLKEIVDNNIAAPNVMISSSSSIGFYWEDPLRDDYIEIGLCVQDEEGNATAQRRD